MDFIYGVFGGDMGALNVLWALLFPLVLIGAGINWLFNKARGK